MSGTDDDKTIPKYLTDAYWETHEFQVIRKKASPKVNSFDEFVMNRAEYIRRRKGLTQDEVIPFCHQRYWRLLKTYKRKLYAWQIFCIAEGLGVSIDYLVEGYEDDMEKS